MYKGDRARYRDKDRDRVSKREREREREQVQELRILAFKILLTFLGKCTFLTMFPASFLHFQHSHRNLAPFCFAIADRHDRGTLHRVVFSLLGFVAFETYIYVLSTATEMSEEIKKNSRRENEIPKRGKERKRWRERKCLCSFLVRSENPINRIPLKQP